MSPLYRKIVTLPGKIFYEGDPITIQDAQLMLDSSIALGTIPVGSYLISAIDFLIIAPPEVRPENA